MGVRLIFLNYTLKNNLRRFDAFLKILHLPAWLRKNSVTSTNIVWLQSQKVFQGDSFFNAWTLLEYIKLCFLKKKKFKYFDNVSTLPHVIH